MKINSIRLKNFKRFSDLAIVDIPSSAKLVVVVGPNGSGKSSLFDALWNWYRRNGNFGWSSDELYFRKSRSDSFNWIDQVQITFSENQQFHRGCVYVRSAYRNDPDFTLNGITRPQAPTDSARLDRVIDNDQTVSENYQRLVYDTMSAVYDQSNDTKTVIDLRQELIGKVRTSMLNVFGDLNLNNISDPLGTGSFYFGKGVSESYHYKNLSGGEKAAFDLILDLHLKSRYLTDTVYCIDEIETHLHTRVQGTLLKEMVDIIPDRCQLWVTTHSLGVLRAAQLMAAEHPERVCLIDFDAVNPDEPRQIAPSSLSRVAWEKMLSVALDDLSSRLAPEKIVVCEGSSTGSRRKDFDAEIYNRVLANNHPGIVFVSGGSSGQVAASGVSISETLGRIVPHTKVYALCDRDEKSNEEVAEFERGSGIVLSLRNIESYLFADDVIEALVIREGKQNLLQSALDIKAKAIAASVARGNPVDDLKSASGEIYIGLKQLLQLNRAGNNKDTFLRDTMSTLIGEGMRTFELLKNDIIDRLN